MNISVLFGGSSLYIVYKTKEIKYRSLKYADGYICVFEKDLISGAQVTEFLKFSREEGV